MAVCLWRETMINPSSSESNNSNDICFISLDERGSQNREERVAQFGLQTVPGQVARAPKWRFVKGCYITYP